MCEEGPNGRDATGRGKSRQGIHSGTARRAPKAREKSRGLGSALLLMGKADVRTARIRGANAGRKGQREAKSGAQRGRRKWAEDELMTVEGRQKKRSSGPKEQVSGGRGLTARPNRHEKEKTGERSTEACRQETQSKSY